MCKQEICHHSHFISHLGCDESRPYKTDHYVVWRIGVIGVQTVFVNGKYAGETPFGDAVPLCAKLEISNRRETLNVNLKYNQTWGSAD